jgi:hypothetical protein
MSPLRTTSSFTLRTILFYGMSMVVVVAFVVYVLFQARFILEGPMIVLNDTTRTEQTQRRVEIEGTASNIVRMTLNGRQIYTDGSGHFKEALILENGYTIATLHAEDRYGRETDLSKAFVYTGAEAGIN